MTRRPENVPAAGAARGGLRWPITSALGNAALIVLLVVVAFWPALSAGFIWDDRGHVTRADLQSFDGLRRIWFELGATQQYYPLLHSAFWLEYRLWGDATLGYHLVNVLLHATSAFLLGTLLRRLAVPGAWFGALLFAIHPVCVESVAWVSEQKNTLSLILYLAAALAYLQFDDTRRPGRYALASALFALALLTKTVTATLPAALLVLTWWRRGRLEWKRDIVPLAPWVVLGIAGGLLTAWVEHAMIGAQGEAFALGPFERFLLAGRVVWFYLAKLVWPHPLIFVYPRWTIDVAAWTQYLFPLGALLVLAGLVVLSRRRGRRGPLAVALLFGGTLFPVLGFANVYPFLYSYVADHFQYHASLAVLAGTAAGLSQLSLRLPRPLALSAAVGMLLVLGTLTWRQSRTYHDVFVLYESTLERNREAWMAHNNLGIALVDSGRATEALPHYLEALRLRPDYAEAENNLGFALSALGRHAEALPHLMRALELKPGYLQARNNLAEALIVVGRTDEGVEVFRETLRLNPGDGDAHFNLGLALARAGRTAEALPCFEDAVRIRPNDAKYVLHLGLALMFNDRFAEAEPQFRRALELDPHSASAHYMFGSALSQHGRHAEAVSYFEEALRLQPDFAEAHLDLAVALRALGRHGEAQLHHAEAQRLHARQSR